MNAINEHTMSDSTNRDLSPLPERSFEERKKDITEINKRVEDWLKDINSLYRQTYDNIKFLRTKIDSKECLNLLAEINANTVAICDLYTTSLQLIIDINYREFFQMMQMMQDSTKKQMNMDSVYNEPNETTLDTIKEPRSGKYAGTVNTSNMEAFLKSCE
ncbi:MAG: hypothetical protein LBV72_19210 [Tannerella sp.]|jgi:hypothetical protein|nr:hypothetical protein [Tannerella sp.]